MVRIRCPASRFGGSGQSEVQLVDNRVSAGQRDDPWGASRELPRLRQLRFELHRVERLVVADHCPADEHRDQRRWHQGRLPHGERPGFGRGRPGRRTARSFQRHFGQLPAQSALHVRRCRLDRERAHTRAQRRLLPRRPGHVPRLVGRPGLQRSGRRPDRQREPRSSRRDHDPTGDRRLSERMPGVRGSTFNLGRGTATTRRCAPSPATASTWLTAQSATAHRGRPSRRRNVRLAQRRIAPYVAIPIALNAVVLAHSANEVQSHSLSGASGRTDRLFAAQDHPRAVRPTPEQWWLRGRLGERAG